MARKDEEDEYSDEEEAFTKRKRVKDGVKKFIESEAEQSDEDVELKKEDIKAAYYQKGQLDRKNKGIDLNKMEDKYLSRQIKKEQKEQRLRERQKILLQLKQINNEKKEIELQRKL